MGCGTVAVGTALHVGGIAVAQRPSHVWPELPLDHVWEMRLIKRLTSPLTHRHHHAETAIATLPLAPQLLPSSRRRLSHTDSRFRNHQTITFVFTMIIQFLSDRAVGPRRCSSLLVVLYPLRPPPGCTAHRESHVIGCSMPRGMTAHARAPCRSHAFARFCKLRKAIVA